MPITFIIAVLNLFLLVYPRPEKRTLFTENRSHPLILLGTCTQG